MLYLFGQLALSDALFYDADYQVADCQPAAAPVPRLTAPEPAAGDHHPQRVYPQPQSGRPTSPTSAC